ncbi:MAG: trigger factor [Eubacterium sp.]|nr:trigger factor [Eubacterium sp.]
MKVLKVGDAEKNVKELEIQIDRAEFDAAVDAAFKKNAGKMNVPGFRKGKAPRAIIEKMYGKGVFYEDALNEVVPKAYSDALTETALEVVSAPEYDVKSLDDDGVVITVKVFVKPECTLKAYKGLKAEKENVTVGDEAVDHEIQTVRERNAREVDVTDRPAQNGDCVVFDFEGFADGKAFEGGKAEKYHLKLGSGQFIPGFEEQICGHNIGDEFDVEVTFPADYHETTLAGKPATFKCKLHEIKFDELPALDDEFVKDVSEFDTLDEYKADIKAKLEENAKKAQQAKIDEQLLDALCENLEAEIPEAMFETELDACLRDYENRLRYQGIDMKTFMQYTGATVDSLKAQLRPQAEKNVKIRLALEAVAKLEGLTADAEKIEAEYKKIADAYGLEIEKVKAAVNEKDIAADVVVAEALDFVRANAEVKTKRAAAKKSTKKAETAEDGAETVDAAEPAKKTTRKSTKKTTEAKTEETKTEGDAE